MAKLEKSEGTDSLSVDAAVAKEIYGFIREQLKGTDRRKALADSGRFTGILSRRKRKHKFETLLELTGKDVQFQSLIGHAMEKASQIPGRTINELLNHGYMIGLPPYSIHKIASDFRVNPVLIKRIFLNQDNSIQLSNGGWIVYDAINEMVVFTWEYIAAKSDKSEGGSNI